VLDAHRREDLLAYCVSELWLASRRYDGSRYPDFTTFARAVARRRAIDWLRSDLGRTRWAFRDHVCERERPHVLSLDAGSLGPELGSALGSRSLDPAECGDPDLGRVLERGGSSEAWNAAEEGRRDAA
jgi:DNA-directed RNA polymerase specialized sigma24 family protein